MTGPSGASSERPKLLLLLPWWHAAFATTVVFTAVVTAVELPFGPRLAASLGLYALLVVWYRISPGGLRRGHGGALYLAGAVALFAAAVALSPNASWLLFVLIPQCFVVLELRPAWAAVLGLSLMSSASQLAQKGLTREQAVTIAIFGVMTVVLSVLISGWVIRIAEQSQQRAELIEDLDRTRAELVRVSRDAGMAAERERLAGEIHDTLAQGFTSILMLLQVAQANLDRDAPDPPASVGATAGAASVQTAFADTVRTQLSLAEATARNALAEARSFVAALAPIALQSAPLTEAVRRVVEDFGARSGVRARLEVTGQPRALPANTEVVLLRATQEALANIHRHAGATQATVRLAYGAGGSSLTVTDDGRGFDPDAARGYGLRGMRARAEQVGGRLSVRAAGGEGSTIELHVP